MGQVDLGECDEDERGNENGNENEKVNGRQITVYSYAGILAVRD